MSHSDSPNTGTVRTDALLTIAKVAERLGVSRPYASMLADVGKLGEVTVAKDGHRRVRASAVDAYLAACNKQNEGVPSPREAGADAGLYDYPERHHQKQLTDLMAEMPDGLPRVPGWDETPDVGLEFPRVPKR